MMIKGINEMRMFLTDGLFGRCLEQIGPIFNCFNDAMRELYMWQNNKTTRKFYDIDEYFEIYYDDEKSETAIGFGDDKYFILLTNCNEKDIETIDYKMTEKEKIEFNKRKNEIEEMFKNAKPSDFKLL